MEKLLLVSAIVVCVAYVLCAVTEKLDGIDINNHDFDFDPDW